jgi:1-acyl-sn-glycerol-3-phosphate acyltransferase
MSQMHLLRDRRYWPLFWTQFCGAFNDNLFKNALVILITYRSISVFGLAPAQGPFLCSAVFILPFFIFSPFAGQLSDKVAKSQLIRWVKALEIAAMGLAAFGFWAENMPLLLFVLFVMGFHSALFGPAKYSVLPELVSSTELVGANALIESGTFLAILFGTIAGGVLISFGEAGEAATAVSVVLLALIGGAFSLAVRRTEPGDANLRVRINPVPALSSVLKILRADRSVLHSVMGISWFWFLGIGMLSLMPTYCRDVLRGNEQVATFCLALFCVGIGVGSVLCERLSQHRLELGLVPLGSLGLSLFVADLWWVGSPYPAGHAPRELLGVAEFLTYPGSYRVGLDLLMTALFGGVYTLVQQRSPRNERSRVIAGNNVMNSGFMVAASILLLVLSKLGLGPVEIFLVLSLMNAAVAVYIYGLLPEFLLRFVVWGLSHIMYRVHVSGREQIPAEGPCILVSNHVSFVDWMIIAAACPRPARFVMYHGFLKMPVFGVFFRDAKVIPIAPAHEDQGLLDEAFERIAEELRDGQVVCLFPEGKLTSDGNMNTFRTGIERILARTPVPVVPMAIQGMWGSFFSRKDRAALRKPFRRIWSRVSLLIGAPLSPAGLSADELARVVAKLGGFSAPNPNATNS